MIRKLQGSFSPKRTISRCGWLCGLCNLRHYLVSSRIKESTLVVSFGLALWPRTIYIPPFSTRVQTNCAAEKVDGGDDVGPHSTRGEHQKVCKVFYVKKGRSFKILRNAYETQQSTDQRVIPFQKRTMRPKKHFASLFCGESPSRGASGW